MSCPVCDLNLTIETVYTLTPETFTCPNCRFIDTSPAHKQAAYKGITFFSHEFEIIESEKDYICPHCSGTTRIVYIECRNDDYRKRRMMKQPFPPNDGLSLAEELFTTLKIAKPIEK